jgi:uncharacterized metal-binding protein YceD (DUF177 family)
MCSATDLFKLYIDQLRQGKTAEIDEVVTPEAVELPVDEDLAFTQPIALRVQAYVADQELIIHLSADTKATLPCVICNELQDVDVSLDDLYFAEPLDEIKGAVYDFKPLLRDSLLLEVPHFIECSGGNCEGRAELEKYFKKPGVDKEEENETFHPFADLD